MASLRPGEKGNGGMVQALDAERALVDVARAAGRCRTGGLSAERQRKPNVRWWTWCELQDGVKRVVWVLSRRISSSQPAAARLLGEPPCGPAAEADRYGRTCCHLVPPRPTSPRAGEGHRRRSSWSRGI